MISDFKKRIKVDVMVKKKPRSERTIPELTIGETYYISFGANWAYPCILKEIIQEHNEPEVTVEIEKKPLKKKVYDIEGNIIKRPVSVHTVHFNEIGETPEHAVENEVC